MIGALLLGFTLFAISLCVHLWMLRGAKAVSPPGKDPRHLRLLAGSSISTVGLGDILPGGHMRAISGIAALTGFILISCTAQYVYKTMSQQED